MMRGNGLSCPCDRPGIRIKDRREGDGLSGDYYGYKLRILLLR